MEYHIETNDHEAFDKAFDRLFTLYSESKDSYWLGQLGELCLSLGLEVYVEKIVDFMIEEKTNDFFMACHASQSSLFHNER